MARLDGKVALLIGAGGGLGAVTARMMAVEGARIVVADYREESAHRVSEQIRSAGGDAIGVPCDIRSDGDVNAAVETAISSFGRLNILQCLADLTPGAGIQGDYTTDILRIPMEAWVATLDINMTGYLRVCRAALPRMIESGGGSIILMSSMSSLVALDQYGAHGAAKAGINALARHLATAYGRDNIRVNTIMPGVVETPERADEWQKSGFYQAAMRHNLLPRLGRADDIGYLSVFLASDESAFLTGQSYAVDGGTSIHGPRWAEVRDGRMQSPSIEY